MLRRRSLRLTLINTGLKPVRQADQAGSTRTFHREPSPSIRDCGLSRCEGTFCALSPMGTAPSPLARPLQWV